MAGETNETGSSAPKKGGLDMRLVAGAAVIIILALAAYAFYGGGSKPPATPDNTTIAYGLNSTEAKLLLGSFEKAATMEDYNVSFNQTQDGLTTFISEARKGNRTWILLTDAFSTREGFFSGENGSAAMNDTVCLSYLGKTECANMLNNGTVKVANSLKAWQLGDKETNLAQAEGMRQLIAVGAVKITGPAEDEQVGPFAAKKITYLFNLQQLTVKDLTALGISPGDSAVLGTSKVIYWIDPATGLAVKSSARRMQNGSLVGENSMEYSVMSLQSGELPQAPSDVVGAATFVKFYADSQNDFLSKETCKAQPSLTEVDACYKSMAFENRDPLLCGRISNETSAASCVMLVAQDTANGTLCDNLTIYHDDCLIAVASENGNSTLCQELENQELAGNCTQAVAVGKKKADAEAEAARQLREKQNCAVDSDCAVFAGVVCAPKNTTSQFSNASNPYLSCFAGLPCGCSSGFCAYAKNDTYYQCVNNVDDGNLQDFINKRIAAENVTKNGTGGNSTGA